MCSFDHWACWLVFRWKGKHARKVHEWKNQCKILFKGCGFCEKISFCRRFTSFLSDTQGILLSTVLSTKYSNEWWYRKDNVTAFEDAADANQSGFELAFFQEWLDSMSWFWLLVWKSANFYYEYLVFDDWKIDWSGLLCVVTKNSKLYSGVWTCLK